MGLAINNLIAQINEYLQSPVQEILPTQEQKTCFDPKEHFETIQEVLDVISTAKRLLTNRRTLYHDFYKRYKYAQLRMEMIKQNYSYRIYRPLINDELLRPVFLGVDSDVLTCYKLAQDWREMLLRETKTDTTHTHPRRLF